MEEEADKAGGSGLNRRVEGWNEREQKEDGCIRCSMEGAEKEGMGWKREGFHNV